MCLKDDIKKAKNSSTIVLSSVNDEGVNLGVNSSEFTYKPCRRFPMRRTTTSV